MAPGIAGTFLEADDPLSKRQRLIAGIFGLAEATGSGVTTACRCTPGRPCSCMRGELADA